MLDLQGGTMPHGNHIARSLAIGSLALFPVFAQGAAQTPPSAPVTVVNTSANPVPVGGTVNVGNLGATTLPVSVTNFPATQPVSGTVNVGNLPAVQSVTVTNASSAPVFSNVLNAAGMAPFVTT
jgi:hypothetical protein